MGTVSHLHGNQRPPAHRIGSEEDATLAARALAADFRQQASERDINRILPYAELDRLSQSGLTAITVPPEYDGLDVSNALLAEIVAIIAEADASIAECLAANFTALESLRFHAGEELKVALFQRALAGDRFASAAFAEGDIVPLALGHQLSGRSRSAPGILFADWFGVSAPGRNVIIYLAHDAEGLQAIDDWDGFGQRTNGTAALVAKDVHAEAAVSATASAAALGSLLNAGVDLGIARAALASLAVHGPLPDHAGKLVIGMEAASALLERAGQKLDIAQINTSGPAPADAEFSADAARAYASELALQTTTAIFEISEKDIGGIGLNLDRHWRNARIRASGNMASNLNRKAAAHHSKLTTE